MPYACRTCHKWFSVKINEVMQDSNLGYRVWVIALFLRSSHPKGFLATRLGITWKSAHRL